MSPFVYLGFWLTQTLAHPPSLLQTHIHKHTQKPHTCADNCHYRASSKYSNSIRGDVKGLIRADELHSWVPFFLLLLIAAISDHVGKLLPDNSSSYKWPHLLYLRSWHPRKYHLLCRQMWDVGYLKGWMSSAPQTGSWYWYFIISFS